MLAIKKAVALLGGQTETGKLLNVRQQMVSSWIHVNKQAPAKYIKQISELTNNEVTVEQLLADHEKNQSSKQGMQQ